MAHKTGELHHFLSEIILFGGSFRLEIPEKAELGRLRELTYKARSPTQHLPLGLVPGIITSTLKYEDRI